MQRSDFCTIHLPDAAVTERCGESLARSLYEAPLTCYLRGPLGAGKTTFLRGFFRGLGVQEPVTSPTYALEQRYHTTQFGELLHLDLYRLKPAEAQELSRQSDDHPGIRCIEWAERLREDLTDGIHITLTDEGAGRRLQLEFRDIALPSQTDIATWREEVNLPANVVAHCDAVAALSVQLAESLIQQGIIIRPEALRIAAHLHDLLRFVDFRDGAGPAGAAGPAEQKSVWAELRNQYGPSHEEAAVRFLTERGYPAPARIIRTHGARVAPEPAATIEQFLLYYADKRVAGETIVSIEERFQDFINRYSNGQETADAKRWRDDALRIEKMLFPEGIPF